MISNNICQSKIESLTVNKEMVESNLLQEAKDIKASFQSKMELLFEKLDKITYNTVIQLHHQFCDFTSNLQQG